MEKFDDGFVLCITAIIIAFIVALVAVNGQKTKIEIEKIKQNKCECVK